MSHAAPSPAHALAAQHLTGAARTSIAPHFLAKRYQLALAASGSGLDHLAGEAPVALSDHEIDDDRFNAGILFTDRRLLGRAEAGAIDIPYAVLGDARARTGVLFDDLDLTAWGRVVVLKGLPDVPAAAAFLQALCHIHPGYRAPAPRPLAFASPDDPTGGLAARGDIWSRDVRILPLVGMALEAHRAGRLAPEAGLDQVTRAMLLDRTLTFGRGASEGWYTSALAPADLAHAFTCMLGAPAAVRPDGHAQVLDFVMERRSNAGAAASTAVGLVALGLFGVGWVSTPGRSLGAVRVKIAPGHASSGFALYDPDKPLSQEWSGFVRKLFEILPRIEARMLLQRAAFGWSMQPAELDGAPVEAIYRAVAETIGPLDLGIFFPPPPR